jgi:hypothetical protein
MSWRPNCAIAPSWVTCYGSATQSVTVKLHVRGSEPSHDLERWSG